jgi:hypothetical protein
MNNNNDENNDNNNNNKNILDHREYNINIQNEEFNLRIEIDQEYIYFILTRLNESLECNFKSKMNLITIVNKLELNTIKYSNLELIIDIFDSIYEKNKILVNIIDDNSCNLIIKYTNMFEEEITNELKLYKEYMNNNDKFNILYNKINSIKDINYKFEDNKEIENIKKQLNELIEKINKREEEINDILNKKDIIIKELNEKISKQENEILINNKNINYLINKKFVELENNLNDKINKQIKRNSHSSEENKKLEIFEKKKEKDLIKINKIKGLKIEDNSRFSIKKNDIDNIIKDINLIKEEIKEMNNKIKNNDEKILKFENIINNHEVLLNELNENINNYQNDNDDKSNKSKKPKDKINYKFQKNPINLKYKLDITNSNTSAGWNDMFEIFISYKDKKGYLVSPNCSNFNLDIFELSDNNEKITSIQGHKNNIRTIRYFINKNNNINKEYLISGDDNRIVILWDINDNYKILHRIDTKYQHNINSCLLIFPHNNNDNFIVTSTYNESENNDRSATKIYSLNNGNLIKYIKDTNKTAIYYLLSWYNKNNDKYYIIQFSYKRILINSLLEDELYSEFIHEPEDNHFSGFIYKRDEADYLCTSSSNGFITIWNLYNKKFSKNININKCKLAHIIQWNDLYTIVADVNNRSFKIIDFEDNKVISDIKGLHTDDIVCIKKFYHPIYGESLLSTGRDKTIKLWTL